LTLPKRRRKRKLQL